MTGSVRYVPKLKSREEIEYMLEYISRTYVPMHDYARGGAAVCRWILGRDHASPVTGQVLNRPVTCNDVRHEGYESQVAMANGGIAAVGRVSLDFLNGVDDWASWATGSQGVSLPDDWPFDQGPPLPPVR
ncbi:hypothetical protein [Micromonospora fulviviridis]|uniref:Uncharacterized protein n=1 Tax=Micromonospora fulviviridis TaxID=47860 RepID=A0ABV2VUB0_9ACTN